MTRVKPNEVRFRRRALREHRRDFVDNRPKRIAVGPEMTRIVSRGEAYAEWDALHATHGLAVVHIRDFSPVWNRVAWPFKAKREKGGNG